MLAEDTPLLPQNDYQQTKNRRCRTYKRLGALIVTLLVPLLVLIYCVLYAKSQLPAALKDAASAQLSQVEFLGLEDEQSEDSGLVFGVQLDYELVYEQSWVSALCSFVSSVDIAVSGHDVQYIELGQQYVLGNFTTSEIRVPVAQNTRETLNFNVTYWPESKGLGKILQKYLKNPNDTFHLRGKPTVDVYKWGGHQQVPLDIDEEISLPSSSRD